MEAPKKSENRFSYWDEKLDDHEKHINSVFMGLSGGLLAFVAQYVRNLPTYVAPSDNNLLAMSIVLSSLSLAFGVLRTFLRTNVYSKNANLANYLLKKEEQESLKRKEEAEKLARSSNQNVVTSVFLDRPSGEKSSASETNMDAILPMNKEINDKLSQFSFIIQAKRSEKWIKTMKILGPLQVLCFLAGAIYLAIFVFKQLY